VKWKIVSIMDTVVMLCMCALTFFTWCSFINRPDRHGKTPLHAAVCTGNETIVMLLLNQHADVNTVTTTHVTMTPLHAAAKKNNIGMLELLLKAGGKPIKNDVGIDPCAMLMDNMARKKHKSNRTLLDKLKSN